MIDRRARKVAAELIGQLRNFGITNLEFEERWPSYDKRDRALKATETMLWHFYDDTREHKLAGEQALSEEGCRLFDRCILFLTSDLEYRFPNDDFLHGDFIGERFFTATSAPGPITGLGLSDHSPQHAASGQAIVLRIFGEGAFWPFFDRLEYEQHSTG